MLVKFGLFSLIFLVLLLPQAQSSRSRLVLWSTYVPHTHHTHVHHHQASSSQSRDHLLTSSSQLHELPKPHIQMVARSNEKHSQYADLDIAMVTVLPHHQVQQLGGMLDTPVSGPNPGGNSESLAASTGQNLLGNMLDTPVSGPNPGGNSESLLASGPNLGGSSNTITSMLDTPVSGPNPSGNANTLGNMLDTPVSSPNPGSNSQVLTVSAKTLTNMLDTPVSGPNPSGNAQSLIGYNSETLATMLDTPMSGRNPSGNSQSLTVAGPKLGGNAETLATMLDTPVSGPNPGGNSQSLFVAGPNSGNSAKGFANKLDKSSTNMLDTPVSGPNPEGNSATLGDMLDTPVSGPNPGGNAQSLSAGLIGERDHVLLSAVSGRNPGSNSATLTSGKDDVDVSMASSSVSSSGSILSKRFAQSGEFTAPSASKKAEADTLFSELPSTPVPPSGPSPIHNSASTNQGLIAGRNLRGDFIGCEQEGEIDSDRFHHFEAYRSTINYSMAAVGLTSA